MDLPVIYEPRTYRDFEDRERFKTFRVVIETSDLYVKAHSHLEKEPKSLSERAGLRWNGPLQRDASS